MNDFSQNIISYLEEKMTDEKINLGAFFDDLKNKFNKDELIVCNKYILQNSSNVELLSKLIRKINSEKDINNLPALIDFILIQKKDNSFLDLKVLAIKTISGFRDTNAVSALLYCLNDKNSNYKIRFAAAEALGKIGDKNAFESLTNIVCDDKEKSAYMKESAVTALGMLGDNRAVDVFDSIINTKQMFLDKFSYLKERIIEAMSKLDISRDKKALEILKNSILDTSKQVRINTIETLMNSNISESYNLIYDRLKFDDDIEVRKNALVALYNISDRKILDEVIKFDFPQELKEYAQKIINEYEDCDE